MWIFLAICSALSLGCYDIMKKLSLRGNNVLAVLMLNTLFGAILMSPIIISELISGSTGLGGTPRGHLLIIVKSLIVLGSWILGYFAIKHLPLTIQGPINASRPVLVLAGAVAIFGERLNPIQWCGILLGFASLFFISRLGAKEGFSLRHSRWLWMAAGAAVLGAISALYDKYLMRFYRPLDVQSWYSLYQCLIMGLTLWIISRGKKKARQRRQFLVALDHSVDRIVSYGSRHSLFLFALASGINDCHRIDDQTRQCHSAVPIRRIGTARTQCPRQSL